MKSLILCMLLCSCAQAPKITTLLVDGRPVDLKEGQRLELITHPPEPIIKYVEVKVPVYESNFDDDYMDMEEDYQQVTYVQKVEEPVVVTHSDFDSSDERIESERDIFEGTVDTGELE